MNSFIRSESNAGCGVHWTQFFARKNILLFLKLDSCFNRIRFQMSHARLNSKKMLRQTLSQLYKVEFQTVDSLSVQYLICLQIRSHITQ